MMKDDNFPRLRIGVSSCLLGNAVRYDGGHKRDNFICDELSEWADFHAFCPEVAIGLSVPRAPIQWINLDGETRVRDVEDLRNEYTDALYQLVEQQREVLNQLDGYIVKSKSPSCALRSAKIQHVENGRNGRRSGAFTERLRQYFPALPIEEEQRLTDTRWRENFMTRLWVYARWRRMTEHISKADVLQFHRQHQSVLLAHNGAAYRRLDRVIEQMPATPGNTELGSYIVQCMTALQRPRTNKRRRN